MSQLKNKRKPEYKEKLKNKCGFYEPRLGSQDVKKFYPTDRER